MVSFILQFNEYKSAIILGIIAFILLNMSIIVIIPLRETGSSFYELICLLSSMVGLICFIGTIVLLLTKNSKRSEKHEQK